MTRNALLTQTAGMESRSVSRDLLRLLVRIAVAHPRVEVTRQGYGLLCETASASLTTALRVPPQGNPCAEVK